MKRIGVEVVQEGEDCICWIRRSKMVARVMSMSMMTKMAYLGSGVR